VRQIQNALRFTYFTINNLYPWFLSFDLTVHEILTGLPSAGTKRLFLAGIAAFINLLLMYQYTFAYIIRCFANQLQGSGSFLLIKYSLSLVGEAIIGALPLNILSQSELCGGIFS
jgi:hypothetical protein